MEIGSFLRHGDYYIVHSQGIVHGAGEGGSKVGRQGFAWISPDFENWLEGYTEAFMLPEPREPEKRGASHYDQAHLGVGGASFGNVAWACSAYGMNGDGGPAGTSCDLSLLVSNDGIHYREPVKGHVFIASEESPATPVEGKDYYTLLCQYKRCSQCGRRDSHLPRTLAQRPEQLRRGGPGHAAARSLGSPGSFSP